MPTVEEFRSELRSRLRSAELLGISFIEVTAAALHRNLGGHPGENHQMPSCCNVERTKGK